MRSWPCTRRRSCCDPAAAVPTRQMLVAATQRGRERADRLLSNYLFKMGIDGELLALAKHTKFEDMHVLTRDEIAPLRHRPPRIRRDAMDVRESRPRADPKIRDRRGMKTERRSALLQWRLFCLNAEQFQLDFQRQVAATTTFGRDFDFQRQLQSRSPLRFRRPSPRVRALGAADAQIVGTGHRSTVPQIEFDRDGESRWMARRLAHRRKTVDRRIGSVAGQPAGRLPVSLRTPSPTGRFADRTWSRMPLIRFR